MSRIRTWTLGLRVVHTNSRAVVAIIFERNVSIDQEAEHGVDGKRQQL